MTELTHCGHLVAGSHIVTSLFSPVSLSYFPPGICWDHLPNKVFALKALSSSLFLGKSNKDTGELSPLTKNSSQHLILCPTDLAIDSKHVKAKSAEVPAPVVYFMHEEMETHQTHSQVVTEMRREASGTPSPPPVAGTHQSPQLTPWAPFNSHI